MGYKKIGWVSIIYKIIMTPTKEGLVKFLCWRVKRCDLLTICRSGGE